MFKLLNPTGLICLAIASTVASHSAAQGLNNVRLPDGFKMELYADETLANDIQAMTLDSKGRVVVTGPGYVKILHHNAQTGRASHATVYATPKTGGMGMWFEGNDLLITAEGWLSRYRDSNADDQADGPPEHILPFNFQEHGGHAIRKGPDGWFYVIGGNDAGIDARHIRGMDSLVKEPQAGGIVRISPDLKRSEVIATGFRNPYDFDFNGYGDIFTYDSDCERDEFLPWYTPTRVFHVAEAGHHGWRLKGYLRCFARKPDLFDTVGPLVDIGRGSPTGVVCYRNFYGHGFPGRYNGGLFILDWTFGRIHFLPLQPDGDSYSTKAEVFLEPIGSDGFAPTDICAAPDGSLFVSIGGRKTRGSVYRISYSRVTSSASPRFSPPVDRVLYAPHPLDAWSRAAWEPMARELGREAFLAALNDPLKNEFGHIRAVEILVDRFDGLHDDEAKKAWPSAGDLTRARIAWALAHSDKPAQSPIDLPNDRKSLRVQIALANLAASRDGLINPSSTYADLIKASSQRIGPAAARLQHKVNSPDDREPSVAAINDALARFRNKPTTDNGDRAIHTALKALLDKDLDKETLTSSVRLIIVALGDWNLEKADADAFTAYTLAASPEQIARHRDAILKAVRPHLASDASVLSREAGRLLAMLGDDALESRESIVNSIKPETSATHDIHALIVFDRLTSPVKPHQATPIAEAICAIDGKLKGQTGRIKQSWNLRMTELMSSYSHKYPQVLASLVAVPGFLSKTKADWFTRLQKGAGVPIALVFFNEAARGTNKSLVIDDTLFDVFDVLPAEGVAQAIRQHPAWQSSAGAIKRLAVAPIEADRALFVRSLDASDVNVADQALTGLERLPKTTNPRDLITAFSLLRKAVSNPSAKALRIRVATYISRVSGIPQLPAEPAEPAKLAGFYTPLFEAFRKNHPELAESVDLPKTVDIASIKSLLKDVPWKAGDVMRGEVAFKTFQCASCHSGAALGPDLKGVAKRMSREDLFGTIIDPARDVAPVYKPLLILTRDGKTRIGFLTFESAEGIILQTGPTAVERISSADIEDRRPADGSLMPNNLLQAAKPSDYADLYAYLNSL